MTNSSAPRTVAYEPVARIGSLLLAYPVRNEAEAFWTTRNHGPSCFTTVGKALEDFVVWFGWPKKPEDRFPRKTLAISGEFSLFDLDFMPAADTKDMQSLHS